jgi:hypothetical protein
MPEPEVVSYGQRPSDHVRMTRLMTRFDRHIWAGGSTRCIMAHHWWVVSNMAFIFHNICFFQRGSTTNQIMFTEKHLKQISHHISSVPSKVASETLEVIPSTPDHLTVGQARTSQLACRTCTSCGPRLGEISTVKIWPSNRLLYIYMLYIYVCMYMIYIYICVCVINK